jgi:hypothetical protein
MNRYKSWTLTDIASDIWLDSVHIGPESLRVPVATPAGWSIRKRTLHGGLRDGIDLIEVDNGAMSFSVLPTRGMGLWRGKYHGNFLGWRPPVLGPVHPKFVNLEDRGGLGWLAGFDEWLCRCGLSYNGPPGDDVWTDKAGQAHRGRVTLHGRIANAPAHHVEVRVSLDSPHELTVTGQVEEGCLFFPHLALTATYTTVPGSNRLVVHDVVENRSAQPAEMQMLYHCNLGPPFLEAGSRVVVPIREMSPLTARAAEGIDTFDTFTGPTTGFAEQVYCYDALADGSGRTMALLYNAASDRGIALRWNHKELPCLTLWKNSGALEDGYVTGLEPGTNYPNFKSFERQQGRVRTLPPGGRWECTWSMEVFESAGGVSKALAEVVALQAHAKPVIHRGPHARFSAQSDS